MTDGESICPEKRIDRTGYSIGAFGDEPTKVALGLCAYSLGDDNNIDRKVEKDRQVPPTMCCVSVAVRA